MSDRSDDDVLLLGAGQGRVYELGTMRAIFKADEAETGQRYAVSEWWLEPGCEGPGAHSHAANEELFYVLQGTIRFLVGEQWIDAAAGSFLRVPCGVLHDFKNSTGAQAGLLNVFLPGGFERSMPMIVDWFAQKQR
ncbi:quercetin dioxygenase-like cupin family protein [Rhodoligotrophos appendicifer]|uniref:cupin domain-containing protein n=1 Tax=Rhodoligotrophos appendicifer TaxID=987056 RepID=UPI0011861FD7|nr:cupin domain-containing protein [Rhodoligotrophos appendicifer]